MWNVFQGQRYSIRNDPSLLNLPVQNGATSSGWFGAQSPRLFRVPYFRSSIFPLRILSAAQVSTTSGYKVRHRNLTYVMSIYFIFWDRFSFHIMSY